MQTTPLSLPDLAQKTIEIRSSIISMLLAAGTGHSAGSLGMADVFAALYFNVLKHDPQNPAWPDRDRLLLSNGHICPVLYATLAEVGYFSKNELATLRKFGSPLQGHPHFGSLPGVENTSGPLGQGLSQAAGLAYAFSLDQKQNLVYCLLSDGEHQEGQTWEAYMFAAKYGLYNLTAIIDRNNIQIEGRTEHIMPIEPLRAKLEAFGWHVQEVDGHNLEAIIDACHQAQAVSSAPSAIICHTIPGKGVDFMEGDYRWHGTPPNVGQAKQALDKIRSLQGSIWWE